MSRDDPTDDELEAEMGAAAHPKRELTDDELEREARADVPLPQGGTRGHRPRLGTVSRAINPRELLAAEERGMRGERAETQTDARSQGMRREVREETSLTGEMQRPRGNLSLLRPRQPEHMPPTSSSTLSIAFDRYVAAALPVVAAQFPESTLEQQIELAAEVADRLLEQRRRRFG